MNREIKFRVWCKECDLRGYEFGMNEPYSEDIIALSKDSNYHLMQYIGLKDMNGVEIYEGDIIKYEDYAKEVFTEVVENMTDFLLEYGLGEDEYGTYQNMEVQNMEVIGNIYENPELLEEDK